ncbi:MAG: class I SAM-dependent methyltransferase [Bacteroidia bacterium]|nr:class I SAM-dependent methyltransferase [Bacteroidia bacterium]
MPAADSSAYYSFHSPSRDGIGKMYLGREISEVMGHQGASWLERPEREAEENVSLAIRRLPLEKNSVVADIGAGSGYYSFRIAGRVPDGKVLAVDIQPEMLALIRQKNQDHPLNNVVPVLGTEKSPQLPADSLDLVIMVDVYHELAYPREMMQNIYQSLKKGGKVVLLEYRAEDPSVPIKPLHKMTAAQVRKEMEAVGLTFVENQDMLPWQHFLVFER